MDVRKHATRPDGVTVEIVVDHRSTHVVWSLYRDGWVDWCTARSADGARRAATVRAIRNGRRVVAPLNGEVA
jgi:hypothetical protein